MLVMFGIVPDGTLVPINVILIGYEWLVKNKLVAGVLELYRFQHLLNYLYIISASID